MVVKTRASLAFFGGIQQPPRNIEPGSLVDLLDAAGEFVEGVIITPWTDIAVRALTRQDEAVDQAFFRKRVERGRPGIYAARPWT